MPQDFYVFDSPMKRAFFFIFLFTLLLRGVDQVSAGKLVHTTCFLAEQEFRKTQEGRGNQSGEDQGTIRIIHALDHQQDLVFEEIIENDNHNNARKYKLLTGFLSVPTHTFFQNYLYGCLSDCLPGGNYLSCKYIAQRALRI